MKIIVTDTEKKDERKKAHDYLLKLDGKVYDTLTQKQKNELLEVLLLYAGLVNKNGKVKTGNIL